MDVPAQTSTREERLRYAAQIVPEVLCRPLSPEQWRQWDDEGYLVVPGVVDPDVCDAIVTQAWDRLDSLFGVRKDDPATWTKLPQHSCVNLWHLPDLYTLRQLPALYSLFAQLYETHKLCVSVDRISVKPTRYERDGSLATNDDLQLHTDWNFWKQSENYPELQGGICLADCPIGGGGFFCVPGFHKPEVIAEHKRKHESGAFGDTRLPKSVFVNFDDTEYARKHMIEVPLKKGDVVIWNSCLPHAGGKNTLPDFWRMQAFVRFLALDGPFVTPQIVKEHRVYRQVALTSMQTGETPTHFSTGNAVRGKTKHEEKAIHVQPTLTPLGRCLWGLDKWPNKPPAKKQEEGKNAE